jgi:hypothetical protein
MKWQATRKLTAKNGEPVEVAIGFPEEPSNDDTMWQCNVMISVGDRTKIEVAYGVDGFQVLQMALEIIYAETQLLECTMEGFPKSYSGFFQTIMLDPLVYDVAKISMMVADEEKRQSEEIRALREARNARSE